MNPIEFSRVWKRYRIGSKHDSLRDAIPSLFKRWSGRNGHAIREDEFWALQDVSFEVHKGETLGIIGPNGAGKSTVLKLLSRISQQTKGDIRVNGRLAALIEVGAGFHQDLTGRENIYLNGTILGLRHREIDRLFDSIVEFSELEKFLDLPVKRYSSGMVVRLGFAVAAHVDPEVLLIDEVLAVGDLSFQQKCMQRITELKDRGVTMIFISHNLDAVQRICDRALLLDKGRAVQAGEPAEVVTAYRNRMLRAPQTAGAGQKLKQATGLVDGLQDVQVVVVGPDGQPRQDLGPGDPFALDVRVSTTRAIEDPSLTITIQRVDGLLCHETSTRAAGLSWPSWLGEEHLRLTFPKPSLGPNTYHVSVAVFEHNNPVPLARLRNVATFQVTHAGGGCGVVHMEAVWQNGIQAGSGA